MTIETETSRGERVGAGTAIALIVLSTCTIFAMAGLSYFFPEIPNPVQMMADDMHGSPYLDPF